jgi:hypothetical protein
VTPSERLEVTENMRRFRREIERTPFDHAYLAFCALTPEARRAMLGRWNDAEAQRGSTETYGPI